MNRPSKTRNDAFSLIVEARLAVVDPTREFLLALQDELRSWITTIDESLVTRDHTANIDVVTLRELYREWVTLEKFTNVDSITAPAQLINGQSLLYICDEGELTAFISCRHHAGYTEGIGPDSIPVVLRHLERRLKKTTKSIL